MEKFFGWVKKHLFAVLVISFLGGFLIVGLIVGGQNQESPRPSFKEVDFSTGMARGQAEAPVSLIQYSDFVCPGCSYFSTKVMPIIQKKYIETGKVKYEFRPMAFIQEGSTQSGMGAFCAVDQQKFWEYHDNIYADVYQKVTFGGLDPKRGDTVLTAGSTKTAAVQAGLNSDEFNKCLDSRQHAGDITKATKTANIHGITGTPYIMVNGQQLVGQPDLATVEALIKANL